MKPMELLLRETAGRPQVIMSNGDVMPPEALPYKVWWIPQVPGKSFEVLCESLQVARGLMDVLAFYDQHQFENKVKPDYCNAGGVQVWYVRGDDEWTDGFWDEVED